MIRSTDMDRNSYAVLIATAITVCICIALLIPGAQVLALIVFMMVPWMIDNLGIIDLGRESNGFFVPNTFGYLVGAVAIWLIFFLLVRERIKNAQQEHANAKNHGRSLKP